MTFKDSTVLSGSSLYCDFLWERSNNHKNKKGRKDVSDDLSPLEWKRLRLLWEADVDTVVPRMKLLFTVPWMQRDETSKSTNSKWLPGGCSLKPWRVFCPSHSQEPLTCPSMFPRWVFLLPPARSDMVRMSLQERARAWACTCLSVHLSLPSEEAVLLMDVCLWIRLEDVLFPVSRDGTFREQELKMQEWESESEEQVTSLTDCVRDLCSLKHLESVLNLNPAQDCSEKHP